MLLLLYLLTPMHTYLYPLTLMEYSGSSSSSGSGGSSSTAQYMRAFVHACLLACLLVGSL